MTDIKLDQLDDLQWYADREPAYGQDPRRRLAQWYERYGKAMADELRRLRAENESLKKGTDSDHAD